MLKIRVTSQCHFKKVFPKVCFFISIILFMITAAPPVPAEPLKSFSNGKIHPIILPEIKVIKGTVKKGDTLSSILGPYTTLRTVYKITGASKDIFSLTSIKRGQPYRIILQNDELVVFEYDIDKVYRLVVQKYQNGFKVSESLIDYDIELEVVSATIEHNLFGAIRRKGEKNELASKLADIFAWDIDFIRDIQKGDQFRVLVEKKYKEGRLCGYGRIQAAFFMNNGTLYKAFLHQDSRGVYGYYDENGKSMQKAFLKAPLEFSRISSKFTKKRLHPIFKVYRPHPGVDYAAPKGTPIKTVGDGVIMKKGYSKGLGNYVVVRHPNGYITSYNHMCRFAKGLRQSKRVIQGDVIGYVGMTGYATGPHLDFRMKKDGRLVDPLKHKSPSAKPVEPEDMETYLAKTVELYQKLVKSNQIVMADNDHHQGS